jgi:hypothetical protein
MPSELRLFVQNRNPSSLSHTAARKNRDSFIVRGVLIGSDKVFDHAPQGTAEPYVVFAETETRDWSTQTHEGHEHLVTLNGWVRARGRKAALEIADAVDTALDGAALTLTDHRLVSLRTIFWSAAAAKDGERYRAIVRLRATTEPN